MNAQKISSTPATYIGIGAVENILPEIIKINPEKILIIADPVLIKLDALKSIKTILEKNNFSYDIYDNIIPEPLLSTAQSLVDFTRSGAYQLIIGFGGGSALDLAKLAAVLVANDGEVPDYLNLTGTRKIQHQGIPKILIPTTSGTGTEVTNISVLALDRTKDVIVHDLLMADIAIIDPAFTLTIPPPVTAATGADALTHAIEAYISVNANPYSDGLALQAIKLIGASLHAAVTNGGDMAARTKMSYGSYLAGLSFFNAGVGAIHALAYPVGGQYHVPHGASNAVLIPYVLFYIKGHCEDKLKDILEALAQVPGASPALQCISYLKSFTEKIGIPEKLSGFNIPEAGLQGLVADAVLQKRLLARCPMPLNEKDIEQIYLSAFRGITVGY